MPACFITGVRLKNFKSIASRTAPSFDKLWRAVAGILAPPA
jgi:hypothetical protein